MALIIEPASDELRALRKAANWRERTCSRWASATGD